MPRTHLLRRGLLLALACSSTPLASRAQAQGIPAACAAPESPPAIGAAPKNRAGAPPYDAWLSSTLATSLDEFPAVPAGHQVITIIFELPRRSQLEVADVGHVGVGIGKNFYDWGPEPNSAGGLSVTNFWKAVPGSPWWDDVGSHTPDGDPLYPGAQTNDDIGMDHILRRAIPRYSREHDVVVVPLVVTSAQAKEAEAYWRDLYAAKPEYCIPGTQCTSTAIHSIAGRGYAPIGRVSEGAMLSPKMWFEQTMGYRTPATFAHAGSASSQPVKGFLVSVDPNEPERVRERLFSTDAIADTYAARGVLPQARKKR